MNHFREFHNASLMHSSPPVKVTRRYCRKKRFLTHSQRFANTISALGWKWGENCNSENFFWSNLQEFCDQVATQTFVAGCHSVHIYRRKYLNNISRGKGLNNSYWYSLSKYFTQIENYSTSIAFLIAIKTK